MNDFFRWIACWGVSICVLGAAGCQDPGTDAPDGEIEVEVHETPDLNPQTDDDVDVEVHDVPD